MRVLLTTALIIWPSFALAQTTATTNPSPSLSSKGLGSGAYDLSAGRDIADVTIGMSPDQVKRTLTAKG